MTVLRVDAVLFDMDGTLVDSTSAIAETWDEFAERRGLNPAEVHAVLPGRTAVDIVRHLLPDARPQQVAAEVGWVRRHEQTTRARVTPIPGAAPLLAVLPRRRWAVVTAASAAMMDRRLAAAGLPLPVFSVTADDDLPGKPEPDGYRRAARLLSVDPARCVVLEDAHAGLLAGRRAGCRCIAVGDTDGPAEIRVPDLSGITVRVGDDGDNDHGVVLRVGR